MGIIFQYLFILEVKRKDDIMPKLKCKAEDCIYNYDWLCARGYVDIDGIDSKRKEETCCKSYVSKNQVGQDTEFASLDEMPRGVTEVYCDAINCVYESHERCHADRIEIQDQNGEAHVTTHDTFCKTFEPKD